MKGERNTMDSTVIQEIANQLGMAVDQAGKFVTEQLPAFAAIKVIQNVVPLVIVWALFAVFAVVALIALALCYKSASKEMKRAATDKENDNFRSRYDYDTDLWDSFMPFCVFSAAGIVALIVALIGIFITACCAPGIYGWSNYPEAMLIDMALKAVG